MPERGQVRIVPGLHPVREMLRAQADLRSIQIARGREDSPVLREILELADARGVPVEEHPREEIDRRSGGVAHQGVVAVAPPYRYADLSDVVAAARSEPPLLVALDGVTDPHNLGSIARTADAAGAHGLLVPTRRSAGVGPAAEKSAAGALAHLPVAQVTNLVRALSDLGDRGVWSVGLDADGPGDLHACDLLSEAVVIVVGAEGRGLSRLTAERCDLLVSVPMRGAVASLNASVAAALALFEAVRRRG